MKMMANWSRFLAAFVVAGMFSSVASAGYTTSLGVENQFRAPTGWKVGDVDATYQEWDAKTAPSDNTPDRGHTINPSGLTGPTHSVKSPGFKTGTSNFYSFSGHFGATADIYNYGGSGGVSSYGTGYGTHVIVQTGGTQNHDPASWASYGDGTHTEMVAGHGVGNFERSMHLTDLSGNVLSGGSNAEALQIIEGSYRTVTTSYGPADYQELIYEFWLPDYVGDFRVDWDQAVHGTIDSLRVDSMIAREASGGGTPFEQVPEPCSASLLLGLFGLASMGWAVRRPCRHRG